MVKIVGRDMDVKFFAQKSKKGSNQTNKDIL